MTNIGKKRERQPKDRTWGEVVDMLMDTLHMRSIVLLCQGCKGEHVVDRMLTTHCACGVVTVHSPIALFHAWSWLAWAVMLTFHRYNVAGDTTALRNMMNTCSRLHADIPLVSPAMPLDTRVHRWRARGVR